MAGREVVGSPSGGGAAGSSSTSRNPKPERYADLEAQKTTGSVSRNDIKINGKEWIIGFVDKLKSITSISFSNPTSEQFQSLTRPKYVPIGPVHRKVGMSYEEVDGCKISFLKYFVYEFNIDWNLRPMENLIGYFMKNAPEAKKIYSNSWKSKDISTDHEFAEMVFVDAAVIVVFLHAVFQSTMPQIFQSYPGLLSAEKIKDIMIDILLPENQIAFFLLKKMWNTVDGEGSKELMNLVVEGLNEVFPGSLSAHGECGSPIHIVDLIYTKMISPCETDKIYPSYHKYAGGIPSASALRRVGIQFKKNFHRSFLRIKFSRATIRIPPLHLDDHSKGIIQILLKYEKNLDENKKYFHGYISFMGCLLKTAKDVLVLKEKNIIVSDFEESEIHRFFGALQKELDHNNRNSHYLEKVFVGINLVRLSKKQMKKQMWILDLKKNYCRTPWLFLSVLAANILLILSFLQTLFGVLSYQKQN